MPIQVNEGLKILFATINDGLRHQDYNRTIEVARDFTTYATGHGIADKLKKFNGRETDAAFSQRVQLTQCNTPDIVNSCVKPLSKVGRTPAQINVAWEGKDAKATTDLKKSLFEAGKNFWGKKEVAKYINQRQADLDTMDPNSFVIVEFDGTVNPSDPKTKARPYPFEANSAEAVNYIYKNNELQWLVVLNKWIIKDKDQKTYDAEKYYMYIDNEAITATQIHVDEALPAIKEGLWPVIETILPGTVLQPDAEYIYRTSLEENEEKKRYFILKIHPHKVGFVPAKRFGTILDPFTRNRTCIPLIFAAQSYFEKSIKTMSEFDITNCLHTFPQKFMYGDVCPGEYRGVDPVGCLNGRSPGGHECKACGGTGVKVHESGQDTIVLRMPKTKDEMFDLEGLMVYKHPPIELLEFQKKFGFHELRQAAQSAVYNSDIFTKQEVSETATGKMIDLDAVYDTLSPYADTWSELYVFIYKCIASLLDIGSGLNIVHEFPKDFKMQSFTSLLDDLQKANANGAPSHIKKAITKDITRKLYLDQPYEILKIETKDKYFPFPGKSESEISNILANDLTTLELKVLYANFDWIFSEIEFEQGQKQLDFYQMDPLMQRGLINAKVTEMLTKIELEVSENTANAFDNNDTGEIDA